MPAVTAPPESFFEKVRDRDREAARQFYMKYLDVKGLAVVAAGEVAPGEAREVGRLLELHLKAVEVHGFETRLASLEGKQP